MTSAQTAAWINGLPDSEVPRALAAVRAAYPDHDRDRERAAGCADDPERYSRDVLKSDPWTRQQQRVGRDIAEAAAAGQLLQYLLLGGNSTGKTHSVKELLAWWYDARGSLRDDSGEYRGAELIFSAPTGKALKGTLYHELVMLGRLAAKNGHMMPGMKPRPKENYRGPSAVSVLWHDGQWRMQGFTPPASAQDDVAHSVGGYHHENQAIAIEEVSQVPEAFLGAARGLRASGNVLTLATTNPTSRQSPIYSAVRANPAAWKLFPFSQLDHPNVLQRRKAVRAAIAHQHLEEGLRSPLFEDRGPRDDDVGLDAGRLDFYYALPPMDMPDKPGPRPDGIPGHPGAEVHVFRPTARGAGLFLGAWLEADSSALLFDVATIQARMADGTWREPDRPPDRVGIDCAPSRAPWACAAWGPPAREAMDRHAEPGTIVCGKPREIHATGTSEDERSRAEARAIVATWGKSPRYVIDRGFGGVLGESLRLSEGCEVDYVSFGAAATHPETDRHGPCLNQRAEMVAHCAAVANLGILALPWDERLIRQMEEIGGPQRNATGKLVLPPKKEMGDTMDALDSLWLALASSPPRVALPGFF